MRSRVVALVACVCLAFSAGSAWGRGYQPPKPPRHFVIDGEPLMFNASTGGFRAYLETMKSDNPALYAQLVPDLEQIERRQAIGNTLVFVTFGVSAATVLAFCTVLMLDDCRWPPAGDPNHAADVAAAMACDRRYELPALAILGVGVALTAAGAATMSALDAEKPLVDLMNKHNRLSPRQMRIQVGWSTNVHAANAGLTFTF